MTKGRQEPAGQFGSDALPMRPAGERAAAREREDRLSMVVRRPGRRVTIALALGAILILLAIVLVLSGGRAVAAGAPGSPEPIGGAGPRIPVTVDQSITGAPCDPAGARRGSAGGGATDASDPPISVLMLISFRIGA